MIGMIDMIGMIGITAHPIKTPKPCTVEALELAFDEFEQCDLWELEAEDDSIEPEIPELGEQLAEFALGAF